MEDVVSDLESRGLIEECSSDEVKEILKSPRTVYLGIDPTASSLHLGNLVGLIVLRLFQKYGHRPVVVMGGATAMIGDPSGTSKERPLLSRDEIKENIKSIQKTIEQLLDYSNKKTTPKILNNLDWYEEVSVIDFLRDTGKKFRLGPMLGKESVKTRLNSAEGMSYTEFSYQILQGNDFNHLRETENVEFQIGGSDQYGNITAGIEYTRKTSGKSVYGIVFPLLTRSDGKKFGKSEKGAIWLSKDRLSPFQFYQHLIKFPDADIISMLRKLTLLTEHEIDAIERLSKNGELQSVDLQRVLASEVTKFVHGEDGLNEAISATDAMMIGSKEVNMEGIKNALSSLPAISMNKVDVIGKPYLDLLCESGLLSSKGEARRLVQNNGAYLNKVRVVDISLKIEEKHLLDGAFLLLGSGKKKNLVVQVN